MAGDHSEGALRLLRGPDQPPGRAGAAPSREGALVPELAATGPEAPAHVAAHERHRQAASAHAVRPSSVARATLSRQTPAVGAVCLNWARTDLCGGRPETAVPTAIRGSHRDRCEGPFG